MMTRMKQEDTRLMDVVEQPEDHDINDDVVQEEIDVYLSTTLAQHLYLVQYPLQLTEHVTIHQNPTSARVKPMHGMMELEFIIPQHIETNGTFPNMMKRTLCSHTIPVQTHLCLGKFADQNEIHESSLGPPPRRAIHLTPLSHIVQMRPTFQHVDESDTLLRVATSSTMTASSRMEGDDSAASGDDLDVGTNNSAAGGGKRSSTERKTVVFQRKESERAAIARRSSYAFKRASEDSEEWVHLFVHGTDSNQHQSAIASAYCTDKNDKVIASTNETNNSSYIHSLNYIKVSDTDTTLINHLDRNDDNSLKAVTARLIMLLKNGAPSPFSLLRAQFSPTITDMTILTALSVCAVLVEGNFCLHSKFIPDLPRNLQEARMFVLFMLQERGHIERKRLTYVYNNSSSPSEHRVLNHYTTHFIGGESLLLLLQQVGRKTSQRWVLKVGKDSDFMDRYPDTVRLHFDFWYRQQSNFRHQQDIYDKAMG